MTSRFPEAIFKEEIKDLSFTEAFKHAAAAAGYRTLEALCRQPATALLEQGHFDVARLMEFSAFMERRDLGHYTDET